MGTLSFCFLICYDKHVIGDCTPRRRDVTARKDGFMQKNLEWKFDLAMFDDGGDGAGPAGGDAAQANAGASTEAAAPAIPNRRQRNPLANVKYGKQPEAPAPVEAPQPQEETSDDRAKRWAAAKEEFRDLYSSENSELIQKRLGESKDAQATLAKLAPLLERTAQKYGKDAKDIDGLMAAYTDDDSLYEEEAAKEGVSVEVYKQLKQFREDKAAKDAQRQQDEMKARFEGHIRGLIAQGEKLKQTFPSFDLRTEMQNPQFARLTSPEVGVDVETAYWTVHRKELQGAAMQVAAQKSQEKLANAVQSGMSRPSENGARNVSPGIDIRSDPRTLKRNDLQEIRRRVRMGEKISFS